MGQALDNILETTKSEIGPYFYGSIIRQLIECCHDGSHISLIKCTRTEKHSTTSL